MPVREVLFYEFDDYRLDVRRQELLRDGVPVSLTHKALQILLILVQNFGQTVDKEDIYQELWADSFVEDSNLTQHIYILRKRLGVAPHGESYIETVARSGYRFTAEVDAELTPEITAKHEAAVGQLHFPDEIEDNEESERISRPHLMLLRKDEMRPLYADGPIVADRTARDDLESPDEKRFGYLRSGMLLLLVIALATLGIFLYQSRQPGRLFSSKRNKSIAVLPFTAVGDESSNEKLGLGMADAVITRLGKLRDVPVRPTSAVFHYTDHPPENSSAAGHDLGVDSVLEGTVQRDRDRIRISVRLMSVADGKTMWAENFDEDFTNIFAVQDSISTRVVRALEIKLTQQQTDSLADHSTASVDAYEAFQIGVYYGNLRTRADMEKAVEYFQKAIDIDPRYARAYGMQADTYNMLGYYGFADRREMLKKAEEAVDKALALDDQLAEGYIARSFINLHLKDGGVPAKTSIQKAIELAPFNSTARVRYGWLLLGERDLAGTVEQMRLGREYDPLSMVSNAALCQVLSFQKKFDEAVGYCEKSVEINPNALSFQAALADAYFAAGRREQAVDLIRKVISKSEGFERWTALGSLGHFQAKLGNRQEATDIITELRSHAVERRILLNDLTIISYALGNRDDGYAYFNQLYEYHMVGQAMVRYFPAWEDARADPRIMQRLEEPREDH